VYQLVNKDFDEGEFFPLEPAFFFVAGCHPLTVRSSLIVLLHPETINVLLICAS
jgi:hypothetical protein